MSDTATPPATPAWISDLPEDLRSNPTLSSFKGNEWKEVGPVMAKSLVETKALTGRKAYDLPQPDWKPEQWSAWNKTIGVPEAPDKYSPVDKAALEKAGLPPEVITAAAGKFHEMGLTDRQAKGLLDWYVGDAAKGRELQATNTAAEKAQGEAALKQAYGDKYEAKMGLVKAWLGKNSDPEFLNFVETNGLANHPAFIKAIIKSAEATLEDSSRNGGGNPFGDTASRAVAMQKIEEIKARRITDPAYSKAFNEPKSSERAEWDRLHEIAFNTKNA